MSIWLVRAGKHGEDQEFALENNQAVIGWENMPDLAQYKTREEMLQAARHAYPDAKPRAVGNWVSQLWPFAHGMENGDIVALPLKGQNTIAFGRVTGDYRYRPKNPAGAKHTRPVEWLWPDVPRDRFDQDILYSLGAFLTVCRIQRHNAESRIMAVLEGKNPVARSPKKEDEYEVSAVLDVEQYADDQIRSHIARNFAGHRLSDLIEAILQVQGYKTEKASPGPDGGVDIIAGRGPMGFDPPHLCVQVKATSDPQDIRVVRELKGVMKEYNADQGLFVSWSGFRRTVTAEKRRQFFQIRLWDAGDVVEQVQEHYDSLPEDLRAELPLKRIWTLVPEEG
jgi:restriction system protein